MARFASPGRGWNRRSVGRAGAAAFAGLFAGLFAASARAEGSPPPAHRAAFQVSTDDRRTQALILGNVRNYAKHFKARNEPSAVEIVAFGPGFAMVRGDLSMMKGELEALRKDLGPALAVSACHNTRAALAESEGRKPEDIPLLPGVAETPSGVVRLAELQEQGWAYLRP